MENGTYGTVINLFSSQLQKYGNKFRFTSRNLTTARKDKVYSTLTWTHTKCVLSRFERVNTGYMYSEKI